MSLRMKFNLVMLLIFIIGGGISAAVSYQFLFYNANQEAIRTANLIMASALAVRHYTADRIAPLLKQQQALNFIPESVPAFAAIETLNRLGEDYKEYRYREPTFNPTNPRDRPEGWEVDLIDRFRGDPQTKELVGVREEAGKSLLYVARGIRITNPACLACHTSPDVAPPSMVKRYGRTGGFGWKLNDVVGAQLVSVPMQVPLESAWQAFISFIATLSGIFVVVMLALNLLLSWLILKPVQSVAGVLDKISTGVFRVPPLYQERNDEMGRLSKALYRLQQSLDRSLKGGH